MNVNVGISSNQKMQSQHRAIINTRMIWSGVGQIQIRVRATIQSLLNITSHVIEKAVTITTTIAQDDDSKLDLQL